MATGTDSVPSENVPQNSSGEPPAFRFPSLNLAAPLSLADYSYKWLSLRLKTGCKCGPLDSPIIPSFHHSNIPPFHDH